MSARIPKLRLHKSSNVYYAVFRGHYRWYSQDRDESARRHDALVAQWLAAGRRLEEREPDQPGITITELCVRFFDWAMGY